MLSRILGIVFRSRRDAGASSHEETVRRAWQLVEAGQYGAAEQVCRRVLRASPGHVDANCCLGHLHQLAGQHEQAIALFEKALAAEPASVSVRAGLAVALAALGRFRDAEQTIDAALALPDASAAAWRKLGDACNQLARHADAATCFRRALAAEPQDTRSHVDLAMSLRALGQGEEALAACEQAANGESGEPFVWVCRGNLLGDLGRIDEAVAAFKQAISLGPDDGESYYLLARTRRNSRRDALLQSMEALYREPAIPAESRMRLGFGLGKAFEDLGEFDSAFGFYAEANRLRRSLIRYSISRDEEWFTRLKSTFDAAFFAGRPGPGSADRTPIFVLGLPRSGTSLVEQILASHPAVHGGGELCGLPVVCRSALAHLPDGVRRLSPDDWRWLASAYLRRLRTRDSSAPRITDKAPENFQRIGMIAAMLPNATIVHCRRDPVDTCLSLFKCLFAGSAFPWCYDLADIGRYYRLYRKLMEHWHSVLPGRVFDLQYEDLVADPERQIRRLLDHCGLDFHPDCLAFHESKRPVATRSFDQVRRPIYSDSVQGWKRYERHLQPLLEALEGTVPVLRIR